MVVKKEKFELGIGNEFLDMSRNIFIESTQDKDAYRAFYPAFREVMQKRSKLHTHRLRLIDKNKFTGQTKTTLLGDLVVNQSELEAVYEMIGAFYINRIL